MHGHRGRTVVVYSFRWKERLIRNCRERDANRICLHHQAVWGGMIAQHRLSKRWCKYNKLHEGITMAAHLSASVCVSDKIGYVQQVTTCTITIHQLVFEVSASGCPKDGTSYTFWLIACFRHPPQPLWIQVQLTSHTCPIFLWYSRIIITLTNLWQMKVFVIAFLGIHNCRLTWAGIAQFTKRTLYPLSIGTSAGSCRWSSFVTRLIGMLVSK